MSWKAIIVAAAVALTSLSAPQARPLRILPLGDSITDGVFKAKTPAIELRSGYRKELARRLGDAGVDFNFVGKRQSGCAQLRQCRHGGYPGITTQQLLRLVTTGYDETSDSQLCAGSYLEATAPDIILLHIGTNGLTTDTSAISALLHALDDYAHKANPGLVVLVARIINWEGGQHTQTTQYNDNVEALIGTSQFTMKLKVVDMERGAGLQYTRDTDMANYLHPNDLGYARMGTKWFEELQPFLAARK
jgi:lysophospholipase L1-like esterase